MNTGELYDALSGIDPAYLDAANDCAQVKAAFRRHKALTRKRTLIPLACAFAVALTAVGVWKSGLLTKPPVSRGTAPGNVQTATDPAPAAQTTAPAATENSTPAPTDQAQPPVGDGSDEKTGGDGGEYSVGGNYFNVPALLPSAREEIVVTGEPITDEDAAAYFAVNGVAIQNALSASDVPADNIRISEKGYGHVSYNGTEGEKLTVKRDFRDYLVYNGDELVSIVTLYRVDGEIYSSPSFGGPWFPDYARFLREHRGEELVYVYAGFAELIIAPDGTAYSPLPAIYPEIYLQGIDDPYHVFYHPDAVYVP